MSSQNAGEQEGKTDFGLIFDDFPHCWNDFPHELALINNDYKALLNIALGKITIEDLQKAREYGCRKYDRFNFIQSRGTADHNKFMAANRRSIYRHLVALRREDIDTDSGCLHWAMVALRCMIAIEYKHKDDIRVTFASPVQGITSYSDSKGALVAKLEVETAAGSGEYESWDKIIADKIDALYQWPEDPRYIYAAFASYGEIYYVSLEPKIEDEKIFIMNGSLNTPNTMAPMELRPHWKVSVRKRPVKKTIYDWSIVPEEFNWIAKNSGGRIYMHECEPSLYNCRSFVSDGYSAEYLGQAPSILNFEDSLEARPT